MRKLSVLITVIGLFLVAGSMAAWAQRGQGPAAVFEMLAERLELSDLQKNELQSLFAARKKNGQATREALRQARTTLRDRIHAEVLDELAIRDAAAGVAAIEADRAVARAEMRQQIRTILTAEQFAEFEDLRGLMRRGETFRHSRP